MKNFLTSLKNRQPEATTATTPTPTPTKAKAKVAPVADTYNLKTKKSAYNFITNQKRFDARFVGWKEKVKRV